MKIKRIQTDDGEWRDENGQRWALVVVRRLRNAAGVNVGFEEFESVEEALVAWGLQELTMEEAMAANETLTETE